MSRGEVERFLGDLQMSTDLRQELEGLGQDRDALVSWANENGYDFTREEAEELGAFDGDLSDDQLEQVAGGWCGNDTTTG
jgi:predicted ribosomally synthesized peptide with nif11-like leader